MRSSWFRSRRPMRLPSGWPLTLVLLVMLFCAGTVLPLLRAHWPGVGAVHPAGLGAVHPAGLGAASPLLLAARVVRWIAIAGLALGCVRSRKLSPWIFWAMLAGAELGIDVPHLAVGLRVFSDLFLRLIKTIVAPLIFATLVTGIAGHGDLKGVGRIGLKALLYFEAATTAALVLGLAAINWTRAGAGLVLPAVVAPVAAPPPLHWQDFLLHLAPENIAKSVAEGQILQVAVFAVLFGIALATVPEAKRRPLLGVVESLGEVMFRFTNLVMYLAPLAVGAALAYTVGGLGPGVLLSLGKLLGTLYLALTGFGLLVLLPAALLFRVPVLGFLRAVAEPASIAFATSTSEAALPRAMEAMEAFGVPRRIVSFVIPAGYSFNLDGSTLYLAVASVFVAQAGRVPMGLAQQLWMMGTLVLTSKGVAGVPRATLVVLLGTASTFHLPVEPIFVLLGVDALMDMARTTVNVVGNCLASAVVARWEGAFRTEMPEPVVLDALP